MNEAGGSIEVGMQFTAAITREHTIQANKASQVL